MSSSRATWLSRDSMFELLLYPISILPHFAIKHGLRVSELCDLQWSNVDFKAGTLHVRRLKGSKDSSHYLEGNETRPLKTQHKDSQGPYVFTTERGGPLEISDSMPALCHMGASIAPRMTHSPCSARSATACSMSSVACGSLSLSGSRILRSDIRFTALPTVQSGQCG